MNVWLILLARDPDIEDVVLGPFTDLRFVPRIHDDQPTVAFSAGPDGGR